MICDKTELFRALMRFRSPIQPFLKSRKRERRIEWSISPNERSLS
jgi:hypothetical protein